jgi:hypothetical protein
MSQRLDKSWWVLVSYQTVDAGRCVDIFSRPDGTFGFEEFRRDPEDMGAWTPISYYSGRAYETEGDATDAARRAVPWFSTLMSG